MCHSRYKCNFNFLLKHIGYLEKNECTKSRTYVACNIFDWILVQMFIETHTKKRKLMIQILCYSAVYFEKKPQIIAQSSWDHSSALRCWPLSIVIAQKMPNIIRKKKMWWQIKIDPPRQRCHAVGKGSESPSKDSTLLEKNRETRPHNSWEISALCTYEQFSKPCPLETSIQFT